jgi:hypothetical protein
MGAGGVPGFLEDEVEVDRGPGGQPGGGRGYDLGLDVADVAGHPHPRHGGRAGAVRLDAERLTSAAGDPGLASRTWVLLTEAPDGSWGLSGHANTNQELVAAARAQIADLASGQQSGG